MGKNGDLDWDLGPPRNNRRMVLVVVSMVGAILLAAVMWRVVGGGQEPQVVSTVSTAEDGGGGVVLAQPSGYESEAGYPVGFPHTDLGAASAAAAALEGAWTLDVAQAEHAAVLYAPPEQRETALAGARAAVAGWRQTLGLPRTGPLPEDAAMRTRTIGIQWRSRSKDLVQVSVLVQVTATKGVGDTDPTYSSPFAMNLLMSWNPTMRGPSQGDWVNIPDPVTTTVPQVSLPGTPEFTAAGWKPLAGSDPTP
ncbi:hypothetical protein [Streptosporangium saharense]|uniref:hypothetical protein n=1 Tax=Streptosporangium saharense TaxID=1706840 RepID=UPI00332A6937